MVFDWIEFLALARDIQEREGLGYGREASARTAVSRAYYAAFCHARNFAGEFSRFKAQHTSRDHKALREHYRNHPLGVAEILDDLRKWRNACDYEDNINQIEIMKNKALKRAGEIMDILK